MDRRHFLASAALIGPATALRAAEPPAGNAPPADDRAEWLRPSRKSPTRFSTP